MAVFCDSKRPLCCEMMRRGMEGIRVARSGGTSGRIDGGVDEIWSLR